MVSKEMKQRREVLARRYLVDSGLSHYPIVFNHRVGYWVYDENDDVKKSMAELKEENNLDTMTLLDAQRNKVGRISPALALCKLRAPLTCTSHLPCASRPSRRTRWVLLALSPNRCLQLSHAHTSVAGRRGAGGGGRGRGGGRGGG